MFISFQTSPCSILNWLSVSLEGRVEGLGSRGRMKVQWLLWGHGNKLEKRRLGRGHCSAKNSISSGSRWESSQGSEARAAPGTHSRQRTWSLASSSLPLGMGWWTVPHRVCCLCLPTVGSQHLMSPSRSAHHIASSSSCALHTLPPLPSILSF